jgi:hypothetical protein
MRKIRDAGSGQRSDSVRIQDWQQDGEFASLSKSRAGSVQTTAMHFNEISRDGETDAASTLRILRGSIYLDEKPEYLRQHLWRDSDTSVADTDSREFTGKLPRRA